MPARECRLCGAPLVHEFVDLGASPLSNAFLDADQLDRMEPHFPLRALVCGSCLLVQLEAFQSPDQLFREYPYFSSYSVSWLSHIERYAAMAVGRFRLGPESLVVEVASNDGYLLQYFLDAGVPVLGIEPASNVAEAAVGKGIPTWTRYFGIDTANALAREGRSADLLIGNNVLAHVPDLNDFVAGLKIALKPSGTLTMEFPHLMRLIEGNQFDTIYHEHFSYFSFGTARAVLERHDLAIHDVEELPTHGGSLRIYAGHAETAPEPSGRVATLVEIERSNGYHRLSTYAAFEEQVKRTKRELLSFLIEAKSASKRIVGYGAPAKGNTLLNYCGIRTDFLDFTVDASPHKHGRYLPGTRIPIHTPAAIARTRPDYVLILPWNLREEIMADMDNIRSWGGRFVVPIPELQVL